MRSSKQVSSLVAGDARVLEIGSGTGEHAVHIARPDAGPGVADKRSRSDRCGPAPRLGSITRASRTFGEPMIARLRYRSPGGAPSNLEPDHGDCHQLHPHRPDRLHRWSCWPEPASCYTPNGLLALYGAFTFNGVYSAATNRSFDRMLRQQNAAWGLRDLNDISAGANRHGLKLDQIIAMPSNNHMLTLKHAVRRVLARMCPQKQGFASACRHLLVP